MSAEDFIYLACGCIVMGGVIWDFCEYHSENQPDYGDPLFCYLENRNKRFE